MNMKPRTVLILAGIFLTGAASGALLALRVARPDRGRPPERHQFMERNWDRLDRVLAFTPEQRPPVEALLHATGDELGKLRRESLRTGAEEICKMNAQIEALLTPAQKAKFQTFQREQAERMRRHQSEHEPRSGPRRSGESPPESPREGPPPPPAN